jgi:hypothetical protein
MAGPKGPNLPIVVEALKALGEPTRVVNLCEVIGDRLPTRSRKPTSVVSRDLALSVRDDPKTPFIRTAPGVYALAEWYSEGEETK